MHDGMTRPRGVHASRLGAIGRLFVWVRSAGASQRLPTPATSPSAIKSFIDGNCGRERSAVMSSAARLAVVRAAQTLSLLQGSQAGEAMTRPMTRV